MSIEDPSVVDLVTIDRNLRNVFLTISDHLPWNKNEGTHLELLQSKINKYLKFIGSGEMEEKFPETRGKNVVINIVGKYPLSREAENFVNLTRQIVREVGYDLKFSILSPS